MFHAQQIPIWNICLTQRAHQFVEGASAVLPMGNKPAITSERQARELTRVAPFEKQAAIGRHWPPFQIAPHPPGL